MNPKDPTIVLEDISSGSLPTDLDLMPGILAKIQDSERKAMKTRRLQIAALLLAAVLLIAYLAVPGAASALKKLIGYIPGIGEVDQSAELRVLAGPVTDTRDGFTITVESALLDSAQTVIQYRIAGPFPAWQDPTLRPVMCEEYPVLRFADGTELKYPRREGGSGVGDSQWKDVYPASPVGANEAVLVLPCLAELPAGEGPLNWEIPLAFAPAPPDMKVYPVEPVMTQPVTAPEVAALETAAPSGAETTPGAVAWLRISIDGKSTLADGYYLQSTLHWQSDPAIIEVQLPPDAVHLYDAAGQQVSAWPADSNPPFAPAESGSMALNLQTGPIATPGPARLVVDYLGVRMPADATFTIDVGGDPQPGQTWDINQDLEINGYALKVVSAEYVAGPPGEPPWMMLYLASDTGILTVIAMDEEHEIMGTGGSPGSANAPFRAGWRYKEGFPEGTITVHITSIVVRRMGPWSVEWEAGK